MQRSLENFLALGCATEFLRSCSKIPSSASSVIEKFCLSLVTQGSRVIDGGFISLLPREGFLLVVRELVEKKPALFWQDVGGLIRDCNFHGDYSKQLDLLLTGISFLWEFIQVNSRFGNF